MAVTLEGARLAGGCWARLRILASLTSSRRAKLFRSHFLHPPGLPLRFGRNCSRVLTSPPLALLQVIAATVQSQRLVACRCSCHRAATSRRCQPVARCTVAPHELSRLIHVGLTIPASRHSAFSTLFDVGPVPACHDGGARDAAGFGTRHACCCLQRSRRRQQREQQLQPGPGGTVHGACHLGSRGRCVAAVAAGHGQCSRGGC